MGFPVGSIIMWYKAINLRPALWELCDGTNGTPDLRDKFIKGIADDGDLGAAVSGGSTTHIHTNSVAQNAGDHFHDVTGTLSGNAASTPGSTAGLQYASIQPHSHDVSFNTLNSGNHTHTTSDAVAGSSLPPFVQVFFIMKVA